MIRVWCFAVLSLCPLAQRADAALSFNVTFEDVASNNNVGFDDPALGGQRQATFLSALDYVSSQLSNEAYNATLDYRVNPSQLDGNGFLASAGTLWFVNPPRFDNGFAFEHATTGIDPQPGTPDGQATFDFGYNWNSGLGQPSAAQFDLFSVALHEITHSLGFLSLVNPAGTSDISGTNPGVFTEYDSLLVRGDGSPLFGPGGEFLGNAADLTSDDVFFDGPNAREANGGEAIKMYAPDVFREGSSISHIDPSLQAVMTPFIAPAEVKREWTALDRGIMTDYGFQFVPEPGSSLAILVMVGFGVTRRVRRKSA